MTPLAINTTYADVENLIYDTVHKFRRRYKWGDFDDLLSEANSCFMAVYNSFDRDRSLFATWLRNKVWFRLAEYRRETIRTYKTRPRRQFPLNYDKPLPERFDLEKLLNDLTPDAVTVVKIAVVKGEPIGKKPKETAREALVGSLLDLGWAAKRIVRAFRELEEAVR